MLPVRQVRPGDSLRNTAQLQSALNDLTNNLQSPLLNAIVLDPVALLKGRNQVAHGLGHIPSGWFVANKLAAGDVWQYAPSTDLWLYIEAEQPLILSFIVW